MKRAAVGLAIALAVALRATGFHVVPTNAGNWRGVSDPPGLLWILASLAIGTGLAWLLRDRPAESLLALLVAAAPIVPLVTGRFLALLAFQGAVVIVIAAAALAVAVARSFRPQAVRARWLFLAAFSFYALLGTRIPGPAGPQGDEPHYLSMAQSLLADGDLDLQNQFATRAYRSFFAGRLEPHTSPASPAGTLYPVHAPGFALLILPAFALGGYPGARLFVSALAALTGVLVHRLVGKATKSDALSLGAWAAVTLTPPLPFYALALYPETPAALATAVFLLAARHDARPRDLVLAALTAVALPWLHPKFLPLAGVGLALTLARPVSWRVRAVAVGLFAVSLGLLVALFHALYGRASFAAAYGPGFASDVALAHVPWGAAALFFDRQFGLLATGPLWALALPGFVALWRWRTGDALRAALLGGASFAVGASFTMWWGGACPPARFVVPGLPALALALAPALQARRGVAAALFGTGLAIVALAADAPRALHNRADGDSGLFRFLTPALDLDGSLPSFTTGAATALLLAGTLAAALALAWLSGRRGLLAGAAAYLIVAMGLRDTPLLDPRQATLQVLGAWDDGNLKGVSGPLELAALSVPLDLRGGPWTVGAREIRNSGRLDLPPGLYHVAIGGRTLATPPGAAKTTRLDLTAGDVLLERIYLEEGRPNPSFPLLLPAGARRLALTAVSVQGSGLVEDARLTPVALVPRSQRDAFTWPKQVDDDRYRVACGGLLVTVLDRSTREANGFRVQETAGAFLIEGPPGTLVAVSITRPKPGPADAIVWAGRRVPLRGAAEIAVALPLEGGVVLGSTAVIRVEVEASGASIAFSGSSGGASAARPAPSNPRELAALPYAAYVPAAPGIPQTLAPGASAQSAPGYNLYVPKPHSEALLVDAQGVVVHRWASDVGQPSLDLAPRLADYLLGWQTATLAPDGGLFAIVGRRALLRLDASSRVVWQADIPAHHDVAVRSDGGVVVLTEELRMVENLGRPRLILDDGVSFVSATGKLERRVSLYDVFLRTPALAHELESRIAARFRPLDELGVAALMGGSGTVATLGSLLATGRFDGDRREAVTLLRGLKGAPSDVFHANTVVPLQRHPRGLWSDGEVLVCLRLWDMVAAIDPARGVVTWRWGTGEIEEPHHPSVLPSGNLVLLDNGTRTGRSRCLELDAVARKVIWSYQATPPESFFTASEGGCQPLPGGHVLVTDSSKGRAFEVTRDRQVVWEYLNPFLAASGTRRSGIYRMARVPGSAVASLLGLPAPASRRATSP